MLLPGFHEIPKTCLIKDNKRSNVWILVYYKKLKPSIAGHEIHKEGTIDLGTYSCVWWGFMAYQPL